jgi:protein MpaA
MFSRLCLLLVLTAIAVGCARNRHQVEEPPGERRAEDGLTDEHYMRQFAHIPWVEIGRSVEGRPIVKAEFGEGDDVTLFFTCFHGSERATPRFGFDFADLLHRNPSLLKPGRRVVVVPIQNPDGFVRGTRSNANGVDLNRNYPTANWGQQLDGRRRIRFGEAPASEPETRIVLKLLAELQPDRILSVHQPLECNNNDGPNGLALAHLLASYNGYPVEPYIGFPTPGSFGTYAGQERGIPMVTLELPPGGAESPEYDEMWRRNRDGLVAFANAGADAEGN